MVLIYVVLLIQCQSDHYKLCHSCLDKEGEANTKPLLKMSKWGRSIFPISDNGMLQFKESSSHATIKTGERRNVILVKLHLEF